MAMCLGTDKTWRFFGYTGRLMMMTGKGRGKER